MEADFTLVPIGGLGNRINAVCSAIVYCRQKNKSLNIIWFKDKGLNCSAHKLFSLSPELTNVRVHDAGLSDYILRDKPKRSNLHIPVLFQRFLFDRRINDREVFKVVTSFTQADFGELDRFKHIYMISYYRFWQSDDMWRFLVVNPEIQKEADRIISSIGAKRIVSLHIRRTDNTYTIANSPTELFIDAIHKEIETYKDDVAFFLATDSQEEKDRLKQLFGDRIHTRTNKVLRTTPEGIIDAFTELNAMAKTDKIYGSAESSFSNLAHLIGGNEIERLTR